MNTLTTVEDIIQSPSTITSTLSIRNGEEVLFRPLAKDDARLLGEYFLNLSFATRDLFGPHAFNQETADRLCEELNPLETLRMIGVSELEGQPRFIGYFLLKFGIPVGTIERYQGFGIELDDAKDCLIAPSVADDYQNKGLGSVLFRELIDIARRGGRRYVVLMGGVRGVNERGIHFYQKFGFVTAGEFENRGNNFDMYLKL
ncbi:MAG: GNAT family N-acetyltransferase [Planctomycetota bacterium]|nr:GNAT family N-acetyltransferase [Planctomycetota bacterium]MDA1138851.1 GNAT family N-acetyltransferase [Planctomycetota bacterium]